MIQNRDVVRDPGTCRTRYRWAVPGFEQGGVGRMVRAGLALLFLCGPAYSQAVASKASADAGPSTPGYSFAVLGDLHFDRLEHHDLQWVRENHPGDIRQIENYSRVTQQNSRALLEVVAGTLKTSGPSPFGIIQVGDFVEGLCGSYELQAKQFSEAISFVESAVDPFPFLVTKGNHDITGPGAKKAYDDMLPQWFGEQLGRNIHGASYVVRHGGDLFVFFDGYKPDLDWLEMVVGEHSFRHLFFIVHEPVVPYNARSQWYLFSRDETPRRRERLLDLLGRHRAIVLSGHLHHYSALRRKTDLGSFVQLSMNSVVDLHPGSFEVVQGTDRYAPNLVDLEPHFSPDSRPARRRVLELEKPMVEFFELAKTPAWALVTVSDARIRIDVRLRLDSTPWRSLQIETPTLRITRTGDSRR